MIGFLAANSVEVVSGVILYLLGLFGGYSYGKMQGRTEMFRDIICSLSLFISEKSDSEE